MVVLWSRYCSGCIYICGKDCCFVCAVVVMVEQLPVELIVAVIDVLPLMLVLMVVGV